MTRVGLHLALVGGATIALVAYGTWFTMEVFPAADRVLTTTAFVVGGTSGYAVYWLIWRRALTAE